MNPHFLFDNRHNVHMLDSQRQSFLLWLFERVRQYDLDLEVDPIVRQLLVTSDPLVQKAYNEIYDNTHFFQTETIPMISLLEVFHRICAYVYRYTEYNLEVRIELIGRLQDELSEMAGTCLSGHVNRLFNALQGYMPSYTVVTDGMIKTYIREERTSLMTLIAKADEQVPESTDRDRILHTFLDEYHKIERINREETLYESLLDQMMNQEYSSDVQTFLELIGKTLRILVNQQFANERNDLIYKSFVKEEMVGYFRFEPALL